MFCTDLADINIKQQEIRKNLEAAHTLSIFNIPQNSKQQNYAPFYDCFFRNQHYFKQRTKTDLLAFANLLYTIIITVHILYLINVTIFQNKLTMFHPPLTNDSQFSHGLLNLSAYVIATNEKFTFKLFNKARNVAYMTDLL